MKLLDVESGRKKKIQSSSRGGVASLTFSSCGKFLFIAGKEDREVLIVSVLDEAPIVPLLAVPVAGTVSSLTLRSRSKAVIEALCVFEDGGGCIFRFDRLTIAPSSSPSIVSMVQIPSSFSILSCAFSKSQPGSVVLITKEATGASLPSYHCVPFLDNEDAFIPTISLTSSGHAHNSVERKTKKTSMNGVVSGASTEEVAVLGPLESGARKRPLVEDSDEETPTMEDDSVSRKKRKTKEEHHSNGAALSQQTMEERLEQLSKRMQQMDKEAEEAEGEMALMPTAESLVTLVDQALQSGDDALLEQCLSSSDEAVIEATVEGLSTARVLLLLKRLVAKFEKRPSRGILLTRWLSSLLRHHMAFLTSIPDLSTQLAGLTQMLELRLSSYTRLAGLGGRLDLLLTQVKSSEQNKKKKENKLNNAYKAVYIEE